MYYWVSKVKKMISVIVDWVIGCAAHNKDLSDGECGIFKHLVGALNLQFNPLEGRTEKIESVEQVVAYLRTNAQVTLKSLDEKQGTGI